MRWGTFWKGKASGRPCCDQAVIAGWLGVFMQECFLAGPGNLRDDGEDGPLDAIGAVFDTVTYAGSGKEFEFEALFLLSEGAYRKKTCRVIGIRVGDEFVQVAASIPIRIIHRIERVDRVEAMLRLPVVCHAVPILILIGLEFIGGAR